MSLRLTCQVDADFNKITGRARDRIASAATSAFRDAAQQLKTKGRGAIAAGGMSTRFANAFSAKAFPSSGRDSLTPAIVAKSKVDYAGVFEDGATISGKPMLWLPLDSVPFGSGGRRITPAQFVKSIGVLYSMKGKGGRPLLGAVVRETDARAKKAVSLSLLKRGRNPGGRGSVRLVPVYVGVPSVTIQKKFDLYGVARDIASGLGDAIAKNLEKSHG